MVLKDSSVLSVSTSLWVFDLNFATRNSSLVFELLFTISHVKDMLTFLDPVSEFMSASPSSLVISRKWTGSYNPLGLMTYFFTLSFIPCLVRMGFRSSSGLTSYHSSSSSLKFSFASYHWSSSSSLPLYSFTKLLPHGVKSVGHAFPDG